MSVIDTLRRGLGFAQEQDPELEARRELERTYRRVFRSKDGRVVFRSMLEDLCYFDEANTPDEQARKNYASLLIYRLGLRDTGDLANQILDTTPTEEKLNG